MHMELAPNYSAEIALSYGCKRNDVMQCNLCVLGMRTRSHYSGISMIRGYWYLHFLHDKGLTQSAAVVYNLQDYTSALRMVTSNML